MIDTSRAAKEKQIRDALVELSDLAHCVSGDFHTLHLNYKGCEFDTMHKKTLKKYYEQADDDYDSLAEFSCMYNSFVPNTNDAAVRISFSGVPEGPVDYNKAVSRSSALMEELVHHYVQVYQVLNGITQCDKAIAVANWLQTRLEYWSKELRYFNSRREDDSPVQQTLVDNLMEEM